MTKILSLGKSILAILCLLILTAAIAGFGSGVVNMERLGYVAEVFKGELPKPEEKPEEISEEGENSLVAEKMRKTDQTLEDREVNSAGNVQLESTMVVMNSGVEDMQKDITAKIEKFEREKKAFYDERKRVSEGVEGEAFRKQVSILEKAEAQDAAVLLNDMDDKHILLLLMELKPQITGEILIELNKFPAKKGQGLRGAELYKMLGEYKDSLGIINIE